MERVFEKTEELADNIKEFVNVKLDSVKLSVAEKSSKIVSNIIAGVIVAVTIICFIIFFSVALAYFLAGFIGNVWSGFLIVSAIYLLITVIILAFKERMIRLPLMNSILSQMFKEDEDDEED